LSSNTENSTPTPRKRNRTHVKTSKTTENYRATKNLAKNYGKAVASFACSDLATPYLTSILEKEGLDAQNFSIRMKAAKDSIQSIESFRKWLLINHNDGMQEAAEKRAFQAIGVVFIKFFSVNWIIHSRLNNKMEYLKYRFRMLRRIENPELFTYMQGSKPTKAKKEPKAKKVSSELELK